MGSLSDRLLFLYASFTGALMEVFIMFNKVNRVEVNTVQVNRVQPNVTKVNKVKPNVVKKSK